jgi:hypothetical protein
MTSSRRRLPHPTFERIERAWRGRPIDGPDELDETPAPPLSKSARRLNWTLATVIAALYLFGVVGFFFPIEPLAMMTAVGCANLLVVVVGLRTGRIIGLTFRSRFIARREREPVLYWSSLALIGLWGLLVLWAVWSTRASS